MEILGSIGNWYCGIAQNYGSTHIMDSWLHFHIGIIVQLLVIGMIISFTLRMLRKPAPATQEVSIMELVKRRYASGDIDSQTYNRLRSRLK